MVKIKRTIKCEGRFGSLREYLYEEVIPVVVEDSIHIKREDLQSIWDLIKEDVILYDFKDPYYDSKVDLLRKNPTKDYLSLIPLFEISKYNILENEGDLIRDYALSMGNRADIADNLAKMGDQPRKYLQSLGKEEKDIFCNSTGDTLAGYVVSGNFGIGTVSQGGLNGGGVRSDTPFLLESYKIEEEGCLNLVSIVGFWVQDNDMLVSQIQSCKNATFPGEIPFGVCALRIAEETARLMGFDRVLTYSARGHPIFKEHPENWRQFGDTFVCMYDNSSKKLKWDGSRNTHYVKNLKLVKK